MDKFERRLLDVSIMAFIGFVILMITLHKNPTPSCHDYGLKIGEVHFNHKTNVLKMECKR